MEYVMCFVMMYVVNTGEPVKYQEVRLKGDCVDCRGDKYLVNFSENFKGTYIDRGANDRLQWVDKKKCKQIKEVF